MLEKQFRQLANLQEKFPLAFIFIFVLITAFFGYYAVDLGTDSSFETLYGEQSDHVQLKTLVANEFDETDSMYILISLDEETNDRSRIQDIREPEVLESIVKLKESVLEERSVSNAVSIADILILYHGRLPETLEESKEMINAIPGAVGRLVSDDFTAANMFIDMNIPKKPGSLEKAEATIMGRIDEAGSPVGVNFMLTGEPTLINHIMHLLINDNLVTVGIALIFVLIILTIYFRSFTVGLIGTAPVAFAIIWLAGTLTLLDVRITMMTAAVGAMMVGMGVDYSIHMTHNFFEQIKTGRKKIAEYSLTHVGGALTASVLTTIAGFLAMLFGVSPSSQTQGFVLALAIAFSFLATIFLLPSLLIVYQRIAYNEIEKAIFRLRERKVKKGLFALLLEKLATFQVKFPGIVILIFFVLSFIILPGMAFVRMDTSRENWVPDDDPVINSLDDVGYKFGGLSTQTFLVMINEEANEDTPKDLRSYDVLKSIEAFDIAMEEHNEIDAFDSPVDGIKLQHNGVIPKDPEVLKEAVNHPDVRDYFNRDFTLIKMSARGDSFDPNGRDAYGEWLSIGETIQFPQGVSLVPQEGFASDIELDSLLAADTMTTTAIGFLFVFLIALLLYRSFTVGFLSFIPIIVALLWTVGIMGYIDLPFTVLTSGMMAIVMGIGIDFSIHLIHTTRSSLAKGSSIHDAILHSVTGTGEAISISTLTTVIGFSSLMLASLLATQRLGATLAVAVFCCFAICMLLVPATLVVEYKIRNRKNTSGDLS